MLYLLFSSGRLILPSQNNIEKHEEVDPDLAKPDAVKCGDWRLSIFQNSLAISFILLFLISWAGNLHGSLLIIIKSNSLKMNLQKL